MNDTEPDLLDDFVFEPNAWDLAVEIGIGVDPETDRAALDELADAMLVWAGGAELERLTDEAVARLWDGELERLVRGGLVRLAREDDWRKGATAAIAEFDRDPRGSEVAREVVRHLAMQLGSEDHPPFFCLDCIDNVLVAAAQSDRRAHALRAAIVVARNAAVPEFELSEALAGAIHCPPADRIATVARREAVRARLGRLGELAAESMPTLAAELKAIAAEPLPERPADDDVWQTVCVHLLAEVGHPQLN